MPLKSRRIDVCGPVLSYVWQELVVVSFLILFIHFFFLLLFFLPSGPETEVRRHPGWSWTQKKAQVVKQFLT